MALRKSSSKPSSLSSSSSSSPLSPPSSPPLSSLSSLPSPHVAPLHKLSSNVVSPIVVSRIGTNYGLALPKPVSPLSASPVISAASSPLPSADAVASSSVQPPSALPSTARSSSLSSLPPPSNLPRVSSSSASSFSSLVLSAAPVSCPLCSLSLKSGLALIGHASDHNIGKHSPRFPSDAFIDVGYISCDLCSCFFKSAGLATHRRACAKKAVLAPTQPSARSVSSDWPLPTLHEVFTGVRPTLPFVPSAHRQAWGRVLSAELLRVRSDNDLESWTRLFMLPQCVLCVPVRGGRKQRGPSISELCSSWEEGQLEWLWSRPFRSPSDRRSSDASKRVLHVAITHARHGRLGRACATLSSSGLAPNTVATRSKLAAKHPPSLPPSSIAPVGSPLELSAEFDLLGALHSFSKDVGTDGTNFRIQHLLDANEAYLPSPFLPRLCAVTCSCPDWRAPRGETHSTTGPTEATQKNGGGTDLATPAYQLS